MTDEESKPTEEENEVKGKAKPKKGFFHKKSEETRKSKRLRKKLENDVKNYLFLILSEYIFVIN